MVVHPLPLQAGPCFVVLFHAACQDPIRSGYGKEQRGSWPPAFQVGLPALGATAEVSGNACAGPDFHVAGQLVWPVARQQETACRGFRTWTCLSSLLPSGVGTEASGNQSKLSTSHKRGGGDLNSGGAAWVAHDCLPFRGVKASTSQLGFSSSSSLPF